MKILSMLFICLSLPLYSIEEGRNGGFMSLETMDDLTPFKGQIIVYMTDDPRLKNNPEAHLHYAVVTNDITSDMSDYASDLFPLVTAGIENFNAYGLNNRDLAAAKIKIRLPDAWEYMTILNLLFRENMYFSCDLFKFEQEERIEKVMSILDSK